MFDTPALMQALEEFKVRANKPLPPMSDRLLEEAWHGSILHAAVRNAEADSDSSDDEEGGQSADEEIAGESEADGTDSNDDADSDNGGDARVSDEEESEDEDEVRIFKECLIDHKTLYYRLFLLIMHSRMQMLPRRHQKMRMKRRMTKLSLPRSIPFTTLSHLTALKSKKTSLSLP